jgi:hypothetical protein
MTSPRVLSQVESDRPSVVKVDRGEARAVEENRQLVWEVRPFAMPPTAFLKVQGMFWNLHGLF